MYLMPVDKGETFLQIESKGSKEIPENEIKQVYDDTQWVMFYHFNTRLGLDTVRKIRVQGKSISSFLAEVYRGKNLADWTPDKREVVLYPHNFRRDPEHDWKRSVAHELGHAFFDQETNFRFVGKRRPWLETADEAFAQMVMWVVECGTNEDKIKANFRQEMGLIAGRLPFSGDSRYPISAVKNSDAAVLFYVAKTHGINQAVQMVANFDELCDKQESTRPGFITRKNQDKICLWSTGVDAETLQTKAAEYNTSS